MHVSSWGTHSGKSKDLGEYHPLLNGDERCLLASTGFQKGATRTGMGWGNHL